MLRRAASRFAPRAARVRHAGGGHVEKPYFSEGVDAAPNGFLFGETPPPPGTSRVWEGWELPWRAAGVGRRRRWSLPHPWLLRLRCARAGIPPSVRLP